MKKKSLFILGLESSCDDTAASVVRVNFAIKKEVVAILSSIVMRQDALHEDYRGVVPEIAARAHHERIDLCTLNALKAANIVLDKIDIIGVTTGPGLIGGLLSGVMFAKGLAAGLNKPLVGINHLAAHCLSAKMIHDMCFPYLTLLASGGHCQFLIVNDVNSFKRLGGTIDDAPGECFDKVASFLGLGFPGGGKIEALAKNGDKNRFTYPQPLLSKKNCDFSFSGLKTSVKRNVDLLIKNQGGLFQKDINDVCASFQKTMAMVFYKKTKAAMEEFSVLSGKKNPHFAVVGGVASNGEIRKSLQMRASKQNFIFCSVPIELCTDNAAMIAYLAFKKYGRNDIEEKDLRVRPRWPLDSAAMPMLGFGKRGVKA